MTGFVKFAVLRFDVTLDRSAQNLGRNSACLFGAIATRPKSGVNEFVAYHFESFKRFDILQHRHFNNFRDAVAYPSRMQRFEERAVGDRKHERVVRT